MRWPDTRICDLFDIEHPIVQAPMAAASTPAMAAAAANAGALGSLGCAMHSARQIQADVRAVRDASNRALNLNFFVHQRPQTDVARNRRANARLQPWYARFGLQTPTQPTESHLPFDDAVCDLVVATSPKVASFHFGLPAPPLVAKLKRAGILVIASATSASEARWLENNGADAVIAQSHEAGGHSGWFLERDGADVAGLVALVPRVVDAVSVPVIAAGGIADGRGIAAAFMLGAAGVQIGTAFLATPESCISAAHKTAVLAASGDDTTYSTAFSGRRARTIVNAFARDMADVSDWPDFPLMNPATARLRAASAAAELPDAIALWSGQAAGLVRQQTTTEIIERLVAETRAALGAAAV